ncbi:MAG: hypothetical protein ABL895_19845 [Cyclobacteriaceae bacterium]
MNTQHSQLIPLGKMKGEIDGKFEAFYIALDQDGQFFINRNPRYADALSKSKDWVPISLDQFRNYEQQLHFLPNQGKGVRR